MTTPHALVTGASVAGLSTAFWLARNGWQVTVLERASQLRTGGQNVDVRGVAREVVARMGLEQQIRDHTTTEQGTAFVDDRGRTLAAFPADDPDGLTAELEILRGDLALVVHDALPDGVHLRFGDDVTAVTPARDGVEVGLRSGAQERYDLLVVAEGVRSSTRDLVFGRAASSPRELGLTIAYGTVPRREGDDRWWRWFVDTGGRHVTLRPDPVGTIRATLACTDVALADTGARPLDQVPVDEAVAALRTAFSGGGWQTQRVLDDLADSDDVYVDRLAQVRMPAWSRGRVVVTGDAAWCVTPVGGGGSSLALTGAYVLAASLGRYGPDRVEQALAEYERWMRPLVDDSQKLPPGTPRLVYPRSRAGVAVLRSALRVAGSRPVRSMASRVGHVARSREELPDLPDAHV